MTTQKAIWILEKWIGIIEREFFYKSVEERAALKLAMIALEKQTKKKYMRKGNQEICPCCGNGITCILLNFAITLY